MSADRPIQFTRRQILTLGISAAVSTLFIANGASELLAQEETPSILLKKITRYRARGTEPINMAEGSTDILPSYIENSDNITVDALNGVRSKVLSDIDGVTNAINQGTIKITDLGNYGDIVIPEADGMGVQLADLKTSLQKGAELKGTVKDGHMYLNRKDGDKTFALATLYEASKTNESQVLTAIVSAGRARQVLNAFGESITAARGNKSSKTLVSEMEAQLGFSSLNAEPGSEFSISCWRTMANKENPTVLDRHSQEAWFLEQGSDLYKKTYPSAELKVGNAKEVDLKDDGNGRMLLSSDETIMLVLKFDPNGKMRILATGLSDNLIDYDGQRGLSGQNYAAGSEWRPCGVRVTSPQKTKTPVPGQPGQPNNTPQPTNPNQAPSPMPTNADQFTQVPKPEATTPPNNIPPTNVP